MDTKSINKLIQMFNTIKEYYGSTNRLADALGITNNIRVLPYPTPHFVLEMVENNGDNTIQKRGISPDVSAFLDALGEDVGATLKVWVLVSGNLATSKNGNVAIPFSLCCCALHCERVFRILLVF